MAGPMDKLQFGSNNSSSLFGLPNQTDTNFLQDLYAGAGGSGVYGATTGSLFGDTFSGPQGMLGGMNTLAGFGKDLFGIYGGMKQLGLAEDQFDLMKKYAALNANNQGARMKYSMGANNAALASAGGQPVDRSYRAQANNVRSSI